jgi:hypothetical protein
MDRDAAAPPAAPRPAAQAAAPRPAAARAAAPRPAAARAAAAARNTAAAPPPARAAAVAGGVTGPEVQRNALHDGGARKAKPLQATGRGNKSNILIIYNKDRQIYDDTVFVK